MIEVEVELVKSVGRRLRRVDPLRGLHLSDAEWAAALRLRDDHDRAMGYREDDRGLSERVDIFVRGGDGFGAEQLDALRNMIRVQQLVLSPGQWDVVHNVVLHWYSLSATAGWLRIDRDTVGRRLKVALERLGEFYG